MAVSFTKYITSCIIFYLLGRMVYKNWGLGFYSKIPSGNLCWSFATGRNPFFIVIPYNCLFVHEVLKGYFPLISLKTFSFVFIYVFGISALLLSLFNLDNYYTLSATALAFGLTLFLVQQEKHGFHNLF